MKKALLLIVLSFLFGAGFIHAQNRDYTKAVQLAVQANEQLEAGEVKTAADLINESIELYPTRAIFDYVKTLCRLSDISTANTVMDKAYQKVETFPSSKLFMLELFPLKNENGKMVSYVKEIELQRVQLAFGFEIWQIQHEFEGIEREEKILEKLVTLTISKDSKNIVDLDPLLLDEFKIKLAIIQKDFDLTIDLLKHKPKSLYFPVEIQLARLYFEKGDYANALRYAEMVQGNFISRQFKLKFQIFALTGQNEEALLFYDKFKQANPGSSVTNDIFYYLAVIDLNKKNYNNALINLDSALNHRMKEVTGFEGAALMPRWKVYKLIGDAYTGLKLYEKARDSYTIALLSNPDYEPATAALVNLETIIASETAIDKTPPSISLIEPSPKRGFKITATGTNVMIKGIASDPSGIKEVTINNKIVYAQKGGDFWGDVLLKEGINKVTVTATDMAGNKAEQVFDVERIIANTYASEGTIPVIEKTGKNYCLLVAAQNYSDNNIPSLSNPVADAVKLKLVFKNNYNFTEENIITLFNPELNDVKRQFLELTNKLNEEDNLVIFYAGHGIWVDKEKAGYWLLTDAKRNDENTWLPNKTVLDLIAKIPSRHTLLITDACFSGSVFKTRGLSNASVVINEMDEKISRVAITSGNDTEVPDESVFMKYLIKALSENKEQYLTAQKMFINQIIEAVMTESKTEPRYGTLELAGHIGGDYIFTKK